MRLITTIFFSRMTTTTAASASTSTPEWTVLYHMGTPPMAGRAQPIRMLFTDAGVAYTETGEGLFGPDGYCDVFRGTGENKKVFDKAAAQKQSAPFPVMAPPIVWHRPLPPRASSNKRSAAGLVKDDAPDAGQDEEVFISQLPAIMRYVGTSLGYAPTKLSDVAKCDKILLDVCDYVSEGRDSFHPVDGFASYSIQKEEGDRVSKEWSEGRMLMWLHSFEKILVARQHELYVVGTRVTYADIALYWACDVTLAQFDTAAYNFAWANADVPLLKEFKKAFDGRPNLKNWTNKVPYAGDSMM